MDPKKNNYVQKSDTNSKYMISRKVLNIIDVNNAEHMVIIPTWVIVAASHLNYLKKHTTVGLAQTNILLVSTIW